MTSKQRFSSNEVLSQLFDRESVIEENACETEDNVEEDPDYEASSSDENETLSVDPLLLSLNHQQTCYLPKMESYHGSSPHLQDLRLLISSKWFQASTDVLQSTFELFVILSVFFLIDGVTKLEGRHVHGDSWKDLDVTYLQAYIALLILAGILILEQQYF